MDEDESVGHLLKDPISISDLIGPGANIEINASFDEGFGDNSYGSDGEDDDNIVIDKHIVSPWTKTYAELKLQMKQIDEFIYKKVIVSGDTQKGLMPEKSRVSIRYNSYWEKEGAPYDSSYLRGSTFSFYTGRSEVIIGLEKAVLTMYEGEESQFLISYKLLYGEMGCPPRIKPRADALFIIELVSFNPVGNIDADQELTEADRKKYSVVVEKVKEIHLKGLDFFKQGMHRNAVKAFEKAVSLLNFCHLENESEERDQTAFLTKLYTNLAVCYNKLNMPQKTCINCREISRLTNNHPSCKALFQEARALILLGDYKRSHELLRKAQRMEPKNEFISKELKDLDNRFKIYQETEKTIWQKALGSINTIPKENVDENLSAFKETMREILNDYKMSDLKEEFKLPCDLKMQEIDIVDELSKELELKLDFSPLNNTRSIRKK